MAPDGGRSGLAAVLLIMVAMVNADTNFLTGANDILAVRWEEEDISHPTRAFIVFTYVLLHRRRIRQKRRQRSSLLFGGCT